MLRRFWTACRGVTPDEVLLILSQGCASAGLALQPAQAGRSSLSEAMKLTRLGAAKPSVIIFL